MKKVIMSLIWRNRVEVALEQLFGADFKENCRRNRK